MENMFMNLDRYFDSNVSERKDEGWKGVLVYDGQTDEQTLLITFVTENASISQKSRFYGQND